MKAKFPYKLGAFIALALTVSVTSCNHDRAVSDTPQPTAVAADRELEAVAKAFAKTLGSDIAARQLLKTEALKKFDGDFDVLYRAFAAQKPEFGQTIDKLVGADGSGGMTSVLEHTPNLNISVPVNIDKWDDATYAPLVTFITTIKATIVL